MTLTLAICLYNAERYIEETLMSVMGQTMQAFHLLIVDDCSTDLSAQKVKEFFARHERQYEYVCFDENQGIGHARHFAERHATTEYMMFLDADDVLLPEAIEKMYCKITADNDLMAVGCYLDYIDGKGRKIGGGLFLGDTSKEAFYKRAEAGKLIFMQPTAIYDRQLALSVGGYDLLNDNGNDNGNGNGNGNDNGNGNGNDNGNTGVRWQDYCEDLDLWTRMSDLYVDGKAIVVLPEVLCHYRKQMNGGMSSNTFRMTVKMRYVKNNVRRRRSGEQNVTFHEFYNSLTSNQVNAMQRDSAAADALRRGVFYMKERNIIKGVALIFRSIYLRPGYIIDKIKHNLMR